MLWTPRAVLTFIRSAGFGVTDWTTALALVIACSGCDNLYRDVADPGPSVDARGLFGLDVVRFPDLAGVDLFDPRSNCHAARTLHVAADGGWGWAGCPVPATTSEAFTEAKAAVRAGPKDQTLAESSALAGLRGAGLETARALAGFSDYVRSRILNGGV
jgi:hypothetical protein